MKKSLIPLFMGGIALGISEFVIMGILPEISSSLNISISKSGHFISAYALGVVVGAPLLIVFSRKFSPKILLTLLAFMIMAFNFLSSLCSNYTSLLIARFLSGLPHGSFFGVGAIVAIKLADEGKKTQAIAAMFAGLTVANIIGVPLGTYMAYTISWQMSFILVGIFGLLTMVLVISWLPNVSNNPSKGLKSELTILRKFNVWLALILVTIGYAGMFAWISYIAPLMIHVTHLSENKIPYIMSLAGVGMLCGNILGSKLSDRLTAIKTVILLLILMVLGLSIVYQFSNILIISLLMTFIMGGLSFALGPPIQVLLIEVFEGSEMLGSALSQSGINISNALGAFIGGIPLAYSFSYTSPVIPGIICSLIGVFIALYLRQRVYIKQTTKNYLANQVSS